MLLNMLTIALGVALGCLLAFAIMMVAFTNKRVANWYVKKTFKAIEDTTDDLL